MTATIVPPDTIEAEPARRTAQPIPTTRLVKVELRKMFNTRSGFWMLISIGVLSPISAGSLLVLGLNSDVTYQNFVRASGFPMSVILPIIAILRSGVTFAPRRCLSIVEQCQRFVQHILSIFRQASATAKRRERSPGRRPRHSTR